MTGYVVTKDNARKGTVLELFLIKKKFYQKGQEVLRKSFIKYQTNLNLSKTILSKI